MAITVRLQHSDIRAATREMLLRGSWLDVAAWEERRRAGRWSFVRSVVVCAWLLPVLVMVLRARCVFMPDVECGGWLEGHWGLVFLGALIWASALHAAALLEWWLCEEKYLYEMARRGPAGLGRAVEGESADGALTVTAR